MSDLELVSETASFAGLQRTYQHWSAENNCIMRFAVFVPPGADQKPAPVVWWLSGLTCTEDNFSQKSGFQRVASELGLMVVIPDTSPRGEGVADDPDGAFDLGLGAGFYVDAVEPPWASHYRMYSYITAELPERVGAALPADLSRQSIMGHSMGGHGALTIGLTHPDRFCAISAFAPITAPALCAWGRKAFSAYLGSNQKVWRGYDAAALVEDGARAPDLLIDQGENDPWLQTQLGTDHFESVCAKAGQPLTCRRHVGYDHGFFFISTFIEDHLRWHEMRLRAT